MWSLTITNPRSEPVQIKLVAGKMVLGRMETCDIVIKDGAASRKHAEIYYDPLPELVTIKDLRSSNGTYVNRQRIEGEGFVRLRDGDVIRIGQAVMHLARLPDRPTEQKGLTGTRQFTRELVLEAVDEHPILFQEITEKLNTVVDLDTAIRQVTELIKKAMGVDVCRIILSENFKNLSAGGADDLVVRSIRNSSVESNPMSLVVPVIGAGKPLALLYMERNRSGARPIDQLDMQLAVAISHQTALTLQRIELLDRIRREGQVKQLLLRFVSPVEAEGLLKDYLKTGKFPELSEKKVTVMFVEMADPSGLARKLGAQNFAHFLNVFYQFATQAVFKRGGMVKYLGDGVLAVFIDAIDGPAPEESAVVAGREIIDFARRTEAPSSGRGCVVGVAINSGKALVGYVGTQERAEFNVFGNLIKTTYRMQEYAVPNRIFVGQSTAGAIRNKYPVLPVGSLSMRGSEQPVQVFEVSLARTAPFVQADDDSQKENDKEMSAAFKSVAERLKALGK